MKFRLLCLLTFTLLLLEIRARFAARINADDQRQRSRQACNFDEMSLHFLVYFQRFISIHAYKIDKYISFRTDFETIRR